MRITAKDKMEDCFDSGSTYRYSFDQAWTRESVAGLKSLGQLEYYASFPRPFFRLTTQGGMQLKGVEGEQTCLAIYPRQDREAIRETFEGHFS